MCPPTITATTGASTATIMTNNKSSDDVTTTSSSSLMNNNNITKKSNNDNDNNNADVKPGYNEYYWKNNTIEPHALRRQLILNKYPQIKELYGYDPYLKYQTIFVVILQTYIAYSISFATNMSYITYFLISYIIGGTCNHMMFMSLHELSHNLGFQYIPYNKYFASYIANLPIGIPAAVSFKYYHLNHHRYQGLDVIDVDIPSYAESEFIQNYTILKLLFVIFQLCFYAIRPMFIHPKKITKGEIYNAIAVISYDIALIYATGSIRPVFYLILSTFLGGGLHPCAGHFIAEHYVFHTTTPSKGNNSITTTDNDTNGIVVDLTNTKQSDNYSITPNTTALVETYSYYGILNYLTFFVGYHNEHHDFPYIPGRRLSKVRDIASEFYNDRPYHTSWCYVLYQYIFNHNITPYSRVKRHEIVISDENKTK